MEKKKKNKYKLPKCNDEVEMEIVDETEFLFGLLQTIRTYWYNHLVHITSSVKDMKLNKKQMVDIGFLCRESERLLDDLRKDCKVRQLFIGSKLAMLITQESLTDLSVDTTVRGKFARGETTVKKKAKLPQKGTKEYDNLLEYFYIPKRIIETGVLAPSWSKIGDLVSECAEEGKLMPPGINETYTEFITTYFKNKQVE